MATVADCGTHQDRVGDTLHTLDPPATFENSSPQLHPLCVYPLTVSLVPQQAQSRPTRIHVYIKHIKISQFRGPTDRLDVFLHLKRTAVQLSDLLERLLQAVFFSFSC